MMRKFPYCLNDAILLECKPFEGRVTCSLSISALGTELGCIGHAPYIFKN